jgi:thiol:disulfide interchange protein
MEARAQAKTNKQLIFIDAYASWCGPCKIMAATSFRNTEVGAMYNKKFINIKIDVEKDPDGPEIARMYKIRAYPTLLIIDSDGKLIKTVLGLQTEERLIAFANSVQ